MEISVIPAKLKEELEDKKKYVKKKHGYPTVNELIEKLQGLKEKRLWE